MESFFVAKRKKGLIISPKDWLVIEKWEGEGVPLRTVLKGIENTFKNVDSGNIGGKSKIHRLSYCEAEIRNLWQVKLAGPGDTEGEEFSVSESLERISMTLHEAARMQEGKIASAISAYADEVGRMGDETKDISVTEQEVRLREGLAELADRLRELLDREKLQGLQLAVDARLANYRQAMEAGEYRKTYRSLLRDRLLELFEISELSIF